MLYLFGMWENVPGGRYPGGIWGGSAVSGNAHPPHMPPGCLMSGSILHSESSIAKI